MKILNINHIKNKKQYDEVRTRIECLIEEATQKGMLESDMDNEYTREISRLCKLNANFKNYE